MIETAHIISSGDELLAGRTVDTNSGFIAEQLLGCGIAVVGIVVTGDDMGRLVKAFADALDSADLVVSTGGLGPTPDDLTTDAVAEVVGAQLVLDQAIAQRIRSMFEAMGRRMPENNLRQARLPCGATVLPNPLGTAPGYRLAVNWREKSRHLVVLPGVPREMKVMVRDSLIPWLAGQCQGRVFASRVFQTFGVTESGLSQLLSGLERQARLSYRADFPEVSVRVTVDGREPEVSRKLEEVAAQVRERLGSHLIAEGEVSMGEVVGRMLTERSLTLAVAESCTGGLIGHRITNVPGSSTYMRGGVVAYCNDVKTKLLGVDPAVISTCGAVSEEVAGQMARGVRRLAGADIGLATTGIAGPGGARPGKPVGTVCVALDYRGQCWKRRYQLWGSREWIKLLTSQIALDWIRRHLLGLGPIELLGAGEGKG